MLSWNTESRREAYFRGERQIAINLDININYNKSFLISIIIEDTLKFSAVADRFLERYLTRLLGGQVT